MSKKKAIACSINMGNLLVGACGASPKKVVGCWENVTCPACLSVWGDRKIDCPCVACQVTRSCVGAELPLNLDEVGVEGSGIRRLISLMLEIGFTLDRVEGVDHPSKTTLYFDAGMHDTVIVWEDREK